MPAFFTFFCGHVNIFPLLVRTRGKDRFTPEELSICVFMIQRVYPRVRGNSSLGTERTIIGGGGGGEVFSDSAF